MPSPSIGRTTADRLPVDYGAMLSPRALLLLALAVMVVLFIAGWARIARRRK